MKKKLLSLLLSGVFFSSFALADAAPERGAFVVCVKNTYSESTLFQSTLLSYNDVDVPDAISDSYFSVPANTSACHVVVKKFESWAVWAWNRPYLVFGINVVDPNTKQVKFGESVKAFLHIGDKNIDLEEYNPDSTSLSSRKLYGADPYTIGWDVIENMMATTDQPKNSHATCDDSWNYNCGVDAIWWNPANAR